MPKVCIIAEDHQVIEKLCRGLTEKGHACAIVPDIDAVHGDADAILLESRRFTRLGELSRMLKREKDVPLIALLHDMVDSAENHLDLVDDFVFAPWSLDELELRLRRRLRQQTPVEDIITCGDLTINTARYEVVVVGRPVVLTFKEYELLKFLASNPDHVFTREALLNKVWGYDYYGGDRTVDVHITRLRTKIENSKQVTIETVRNIGYRLKTSC
ncbi:MAG: response regulator transcription factor [Dehalococcoidales bacterium]|nr:response regulator transcription factor [Dehalococcoidales bacterium]